MNKCPNCNNTISSIDVLCPKCGALVEQINTNVAPKIKATEDPKDAEAKSASEAPNHYENLIVYNESYQIDEAPIPKEPTPVESPQIQDDFEIDNIIASANGAPRVNPLFAHIEKHRHDEEEVEAAEDENSPDDESSLGSETPSSDDPPKQNESASDDIAPLEAEASANKEAPIEEDAPADIKLPAKEDAPADTKAPDKEDAPADIKAPVEAEAFADKETMVNAKAVNANIPPIESEISEASAAKTDTNLPSGGAFANSESMEEPAKDSLEAMPAYSKDYLDALRNIELVEDKLEIDEEFDPDAFMAKFKKNVDSESSKPAIANDTAQTDTSGRADPALFETSAHFNNFAEEPPKRRYNPNAVKPREEEIAEPEESLTAPTQAVQAPTETVVAPAQSTQPEKSKVDTSEEDTAHKKSKAKVPDDEPLELTLSPDKFFDSSADAENSDEDEVFVFGEEVAEVDVLSDDEQIIRNASKNPYSAAITKPATKEHKASAKMKETQELKAYKLKKLPIWAAILIWLAVTVGVFFGTYTLDRHITSYYSGYSEYLYEITDGKIDIDALID